MKVPGFTRQEEGRHVSTPSEGTGPEAVYQEHFVQIPTTKDLIAQVNEQQAREAMAGSTEQHREDMRAQVKESGVLDEPLVDWKDVLRKQELSTTEKPGNPFPRDTENWYRYNLGLPPVPTEMQIRKELSPKIQLLPDAAEQLHKGQSRFIQSHFAFMRDNKLGAFAQAQENYIKVLTETLQSLGVL